MADGQVGGNESVHWIVNADDASDVTSVPDSPSRPKWLQCGIDYHRNPHLGKDFTVRVKIPAKRRAAFLRSLLMKVNDAARDPKVELLEFRLPIETGPVAHTQVQVCWGKETPWYEGLREVHPIDKAVAVAGAVPAAETAGPGPKRPAGMPKKS